MTRSKFRHIPAIIFCSIFIPIFFPIHTHAQSDSIHPLRIVIVAPLYLDSAFDDQDYKLGNLNIPKYFLPGLEFYNGVMMAVDSLKKEGVDLDVWIFDTKKKDYSSAALASVISSLNASLIIASFSSTEEQKIFSDLAIEKNIPIISATYPNDAYLSENPYFVMINSTLKTHVEAIYKYVQKKYPIGKILYVTRQGILEDKIQAEFAAAGKKTYPIKYSSVQMPDDFSGEELKPMLDSNKQNVIICGTVNETFGTNLLKALNEMSPSYTMVAVGMPTWDGLKAISSCDNANLDIVYSTPYNYPHDDKTITDLTNEYKIKFNGRPSDMFFKGFETMYCFSKLALKYHNDFLNNLSDTSFHLSNVYQFKPVKNEDASSTPDYIENKKLYFIHTSQGTIRSVD